MNHNSIQTSNNTHEETSDKNFSHGLVTLALTTTLHVLSELLSLSMQVV